MQILLTKKLMDAMGCDFDQKTSETNENPLFSWTVNWTNVWTGRKDDMLVFVNNATRFVVAVYQIRKRDLANPEKVKQMMVEAIRNTLLYMNVNQDIVDEYLLLAGDIGFARNRDKKAASWVTHGGNDCAFYVGREFEKGAKVFDDTCGARANTRGHGSSGDEVSIEKRMFKALSDLTGKPIFKYRAFEILVTLDLDIYKAERKLIVPASVKLRHLHKIIQDVYRWWDYHLYDFTVPGQDEWKPILRLVPYEDDLDYDENAISIKNHTISDLFPKYEKIVYTYDMGDYWQHEIKLLKIHEDYEGDSPYLLEARGQAPPEDVGGVGGFIDFREIILDPEHPEHDDMKIWSRYWDPELEDYKMRPRKIHYF